MDAKPLTQYPAHQMNPKQLHDNLRECWELVTDKPGISLRNIAQKMGISVRRAKRLVDLLLESGTFVRAPGKKSGTLRVTVPFVPLDNPQKMDDK